MPMPLTRKNSAASWCRSRPPRVRNDHSRLSTYDTIVATSVAMIFAETGLFGRTDGLDPEEQDRVDHEARAADQGELD